MFYVKSYYGMSLHVNINVQYHVRSNKFIRPTLFLIWHFCGQCSCISENTAAKTNSNMEIYNYKDLQKHYNYFQVTLRMVSKYLHLL